MTEQKLHMKSPTRGGSKSTHNLCFIQKYENYQNFYLNTFRFGGEIIKILNRRIFVMFFDSKCARF